jgi:hypothetical protein
MGAYVLPLALSIGCSLSLVHHLLDETKTRHTKNMEETTLTLTYAMQQSIREDGEKTACFPFKKAKPC